MQCTHPLNEARLPTGALLLQTEEQRLPTVTMHIVGAMIRDVRPQEAVPPSVVGVTTTHERVSRDRRRRALDASATSSRGLDLVYRKRTTDRTSGRLTPPAWVHASPDQEKHYPHASP